VYSPGVWSPDSARIAYSAGHLGDTIYEKAASGLGDEQVLFKEPGLRHFLTSWSRDGRFLLYHTENAPRTVSGLASFHPTCVGLPTCRLRLE
jgi:Tol biopolymer transport system component